MTDVYIALSAWYTILKEIRFFAEQGNREAIIYPLFGFIRSANCMKAPWEMLELEDIESFLVTHAHAPLRKFCAHTSYRAQFNLVCEKDEEEFNQDIEAWSKPICSKYPTLEIGNVHSHPFVRGWAWPSSGRNMDYARIYRLWEHLKKRKLNCPLEIILCRAKFDFGRFFGYSKWDACCFSFDGRQNIVPLGKAHIIGDNDWRIKRILTIPYWKTEEGLKWEQQLREQIPVESVDRFDFGWSAMPIRINADRYLLIHLPPQFPAPEYILTQIFDKATRKWSGTEKLNFNGSGFALPFREIVGRYA